MASKEPTGGRRSPLISILTPFYNNEHDIAECIESVLTQTYSNWEYLLVNNQSTDKSRQIAKAYAEKDSRIRLHDTPRFFTQIQNFNESFGYISPESRYCKMLLADDWLFPECIERMVSLAEANPSVGIVGAYRLFGTDVTPLGLPHSSTVMSGRDAGRLMILDGLYLTGSPTSVLFRADLVRKVDQFFPEGAEYDDTEACFRILADNDFGFVHQILTFSRKEDNSTLTELFRFGPGPLRKLIFARMFGPKFLSEEECQQNVRRATDFYGAFLAASAFEFKGQEFWDFHRKGLRRAGASFSSIGLGKYVFLELMDIIFNPKKTAGRILRLLKSRQAEARG